MDSNLFQLTSSTLLKKIKVSAGQLQLGNDTFSTICGTLLFLEIPDAQCYLATELLRVNMPNRRKPDYMTEHILMEEARVEVGLLRIKILRSWGTLTPAKFQEILDRLCLLLKLLDYRKELDKRKARPSLL